MCVCICVGVARQQDAAVFDVRMVAVDVALQVHVATRKVQRHIRQDPKVGSRATMAFRSMALICTSGAQASNSQDHEQRGELKRQMKCISISALTANPID